MGSGLRKNNSVAGYTLRARLGRGGNGEVWRAESPTGHEVAIKVLTRLGADGRARFQREVELQRGELAGVDGLLPVLDADPTDSRPWLTMPIARPIDTALTDATLEEVLLATAEIAQTLARLHERGYAHRDVKPGNLYRYKDRWLLGDLGLIDLPESTPLTVGRRALGPKWFLAPEMLATPDVVSPAADVYSLAKTLWVLLTGAPFPPPGTHARQTAALRASSYVQHARVLFLDRLLEQATAHEPAQRPDAATFSSELQLIVEGPSRPSARDADLSALRDELRLVTETAHDRDALRQARLAAGNDLIQELEYAGDATTQVLARAEAPSRGFDMNETVLQRATWHLPNVEGTFGRCLVTSLTYETGEEGSRRIQELHLWSGFGVAVSANDMALLLASHIVGDTVVWHDRYQVALGSIAARQAVQDLGAGLRDHTEEALGVFLATYRAVTSEQR